jgi:hypothetical protein
LPRQLHILSSPNERFQRIHLISVLDSLWQQAGHSVTRGPVVAAGTDAVIVHSDYSQIPEQLLASVPEGIPVINGMAVDIRKSKVSQMLLSRNSDWTGPVMIKTNANAHAAEEYVYHRIRLVRLLKILAARVVPWQWVGELPLRQYPIVDSMADVPAWVWSDDRLIVDRFMPERDGELYVLRLWMFFGDKEYCMKVTGRQAMVKSRDLVSVELMDEVPAGVREVRQRLGLDFGKIDFVLHDGKPHVFDVNKTPTVFLNKQGQPGPYVRSLADGLEALLT